MPHKSTGRSILVALVIFVPTLLSFTGSEIPGPIGEKLISYHQVFGQEKAYLHLNKRVFRQGETIWFKAYLTNAIDHSSTVKSTVLFVELIDPNNKVVAKRIIGVSNDESTGEIVIEPGFATGFYSIRAYTSWMRNFDHQYMFQVPIMVSSPFGSVAEARPSDRSSIRLQFFPEGGKLIEGIRSIVAVKSTNAFGNGQFVRGSVVDETGSELTTFETSSEGIGRFELTPGIGKAYRVEVASANNKSFDLPKASQSGYIIKAKTEDTNLVNVSVLSIGQDFNNSSIIVHQRGALIESFENLGNINEYTFNINRQELKPGVCDITLLSQDGEPLCERLIVVNPTKPQYTISLYSEKALQGGNTTNLNFSFKDHDGNPIKGEFSTSISSGITVPDPLYNHSVASYLQLSSDVTSEVSLSSPESYETLDDLLLTTSWGRFNWSDVLVELYPEPRYSAGPGVTISGQVVDFLNRRKGRYGIVSMSAAGSLKSIDEETDENGRFKFGAVDFAQATDLTFSAQRFVGKKGKMKNDVFIKLDDTSTPPISDDHRAQRLSKAFNLRLASMDTSEAVLLGQVEIETTKRQRDPFFMAKEKYGEPSYRVVADSVLTKIGVNSVFDYLRNIAGLQIGGSGPNQFVRLQGATATKKMYSTNAANVQPLYLLDGVQSNEGFIANMNPFDVSYIDVLRGNDATIFGIRGSNGVIAVYKRSEDNPPPPRDPGRRVYNYPGYHRPAEFKPYDGLGKDSEVAHTIYWNPSTTISDTGEASLNLTVPESMGTYAIRIEGIAEDGVPFVYNDTLTIK